MYGAQTKYGIARQVTPSSWVTDPGSYHGIGFTSADVGLEKQEVVGQNNTGRFSEGAIYDGPSNVAGTIEMEMTPRSVLAAVGATLAHSAVATNSGSVRTWEFLPSTVDFNSLFVNAPWTIYEQFTDASSAFLFYDAQFGQLAFQVTQGQMARVRATVAGGTNLDNGVGSMNVIAGAADQGRLYPWNVCSISLAGAAISNLSDITVTFNKNIDVLYTINGTLAPFKYTRTTFESVTVAGNFYMSDRVVNNLFVAGTLSRLLVTMINTRAAIQSGYYDTIVLDVPQMKFSQFKPAPSGPGEVSVPFQARGQIDPSSNYLFKVTLVNTWQTNL